eukprot:gene23751-30008_t
MSSIKLLPGTVFPQINLQSASDGSIINLATTSEGKRKLVIIYRGQFCPFCNGHLQEINAAIERLGDANIEVVAASADGIDATRGLIEKHGLTFTIGTGLSVDQMRTLGVYISDPTDQIEQTFKFAEPAFFLLNNDGTIRYISIANNPVAGRVNVDTLLMANAYVTSRSATDLKFAKVGRLYDGHILDMIEFGVDKNISISEIEGPKKGIGAKPMILFLGDQWENDTLYKRIQNLLLDFFRGDKAEKISLKGVDHVMACTVVDGKIYLRGHTIAYQKSESKVPLLSLDPMGPFYDLSVRRSQAASDDMWKTAVKKAKGISTKWVDVACLLCVKDTQKRDLQRVWKEKVVLVE